MLGALELDGFKDGIPLGLSDTEATCVTDGASDTVGGGPLAADGALLRDGDLEGTIEGAPLGCFDVDGMPEGDLLALGRLDIVG